MEIWHIAMIGFLVLLIGPNKGSFLRLRVWLILVGASVASYFWQDVMFYVFVDLLAAGFVMMHPKTAWQRAIGATLVMMGMMSLGYSIAEMLALQNFLTAVAPPNALMPWYQALGWAQFALLLLWSDYDGLGISRKVVRLLDSGGRHLAAYRSWSS